MACFSRVPVVDVNDENLREVWPSLILAMSSATFVALDTELSGLGHRKKLNAKSVEDRYKNICETAGTRSILSLGISCFKDMAPAGSQSDSRDSDQSEVKDPSQPGSSYIVQTFNILLLCEEDYVVEPLSLKFLVQHGFDFNKQYDKGIPYYRGLDRDTDKSIQSVRFLFAELVSMEIPIVLHNGLVDLMFLYENLYTSLPQTSTMFLADLVDMFPAGVIDTKYITDFEHLMPASYLEYVFRKCQRDSVNGTVPLCSIHFPHYPPTYPHVTFRDCSLKPPHDIEKQPEMYRDKLCGTYAGHGWCPKDKHCSKSHNIDLIIDMDNYNETRKSRKRKRRKQNTLEKNGTIDSTDHDDSMETGGVADVINVSEGVSECASNEDLSENERKNKEDHVKENTLATTNTNGGHRAGYDAFMTGFIYAVYLQRAKMEAGLGGVKDWRNKLYLRGKDYPLSVSKSSFTKQSRQHLEKISRIRKKEVM